MLVDQRTVDDLRAQVAASGAARQASNDAFKRRVGEIYAKTPANGTILKLHKPTCGNNGHCGYKAEDGSCGYEGACAYRDLMDSVAKIAAPSPAATPEQQAQAIKESGAARASTLERLKRTTADAIRVVRDTTLFNAAEVQKRVGGATA